MDCDSRNNCAMKAAPKTVKIIKKTTRYPIDLIERLDAERALSGRTFNAEVVHRLQADELTKLRTEIAELKSMIREVLDHVRS